MPSIVITVGHILIQASATFGFRDVHAYRAMLAGFGGMMVGFLISTVGFWLLMIKQIAFIRLASSFSPTYEDAIKWAETKKWTIIGLFLLFYAFVIAIIVAWGIELTVSALLVNKLPAMGIPGLLVGCLGLVVSAFILSFYYMLIIAALSTETESWNVVISRSFSLMIKDLPRVYGFGVLLSVIVLVLSWTLTLPIVILTMVEVFRTGIGSGAAAPKIAALNMPLYLMVISQLWQTVINMVLMPIVFITYGLFYRDLRVRQEGLDIVQGVQLLGANGSE